MRTIRQQQTAAFDAAALKNFENATVEGLKKRFPKHCRLLGEDDLRAKVRDAFDLAEQHGLVSENGLRLVAELSLLLGSGFDQDPQLPWAAAILDEKADEAARVERLHAKATEYLAKVSGPGGQYIEAALGAVRTEPLEGFSGGIGFDQYMARRFWLLYPEKCAYVGDDCLQRLIQLGLSKAQSHGLVTERGATLLLGLMFLLGADFDQDVQYRFAGPVLDDPALTDPAEKAARLHAAALAYLERWQQA